MVQTGNYAMKFNIGDKAWVARGGNHTEVWVTCPHCFGKKYLTVIMGDDSQVTIDCDCCKEGYNDCRGQIKEYKFVASAYEITIESIEVRCGKTQYNNNDECDVFLTKEEAETRAEQFRAENDRQEAGRILHKKDKNRDWAWNASYHRKELKRALHDVEYHTAALDVAKLKSKEAINKI